MSGSSILAKLLGVGALTLIGVDANHNAKIKASMHEQNYKAKDLDKHISDSMEFSSPSIVETKIKNRVNKFLIDENVSGFFANSGGYMNGFCSSLIDNVIPLGLALGTFMGKGFISKFSGIGLLAYGGIYLLRNVFGVGKAQKQEYA